MFRQRLLTSLVLIPLVLAVIYYASSWIFTSVVLVILLACVFEWMHLIPIKHILLKVLFIVAILVLSWLIAFHYDYWLLAGMIFWALILIAVLNFPKSQRIWGYPSLVFIAGLIALPLFAQSLLQLYQQERGKDLILYLLFLVWASDIGAYLAGKRWGQHKLIPEVSPGKTIEGVLGGFLFAMLISLGGYFYFQPSDLIKWFVLAILTSFISILGDLFISMLKRRVKVKDTGHILPGHGGILDRLDSLIAALPLFNFGLIYLAPGL